MPVVKFNSAEFPREQYESVLDCLLRHRQALPYACRAGMCQACLVKAVDCEATAESKKWIKPDLQARGYTLACQWVPEGDVQLRLPTVEEFSLPAVIRGLDPLNSHVMRLRLSLDEQEGGGLHAALAGPFHYRPGQYLTLINPRGIARSYSTANDLEAEGFIELHIARTERGSFTTWLFGEAATGDRLHLRGPAGECCYARDEDPERPLLLAGTGAGLAPLYGIVRDALARGHRGPLTLVHGARSPERLYYVEELMALQDAYPNVRYRPAVRENPGRTAVPGLSEAPAEEAAMALLEREAAGRTRIFLCGAPDFVHGLHKRLFLRGARPENISSDPFIERRVAAGPA